MKQVLAVATAVLCSLGLHAQVPAKCLEIESILADACISTGDCPASTEGMNEMVRFITGPAAINIGDLQFTFFSSSFRGIEQNGTTAALTAQLNASIQGCGHLLEPPGGVIPPGSRVLFITSTAMCVQANPFTALNDTLYIIFQKPGNSQGHFKNNDLVGQAVTATPGPPLTRWLRIQVGGTACGDTATYDANQLVNIYGSYGGNPAENDGATVNFSWPGLPVAGYVNYGCQAAFAPTLVSVISGGGEVPCGVAASLVGSVSGAHASVLWQGGGGSFSNPTALNTTYVPGGGDHGTVVLSLCALTACGDTICTSVTLTTGPMPNVTVTGDTTLCSQFDTSVLTASGADTYLWSTGATGPSITAAITGPVGYWVAGSNACGTDTAYITPRWMHTTTYYTNVSCHGAADGVLTAYGTGGVWPYTYLWSNGGTDSLITGLAPGSYSYTITDADGCTLSSAWATITEPQPLTLTMGNDTTICAGGYAVLSASGGGGTPAYQFTWSPEGPLVFPSATTTYSVVITDQHGCTLPAQEMTVNVTGATVALTASDTTGCAPHCVTFTATSPVPNGYSWDFGDGTTGTGSVVEHCYAVAGEYPVAVQVAPAAGCPDLTETMGPVIVSAVPEAQFSWEPEAPSPANPEVQFHAIGTGATAWLWSFGDPDGSTATGASPVFTFPAAGCYPVILAVANDLGCTDTARAEICILGQDTLRIPNVFTPNHDGANDVFRITGGNLVSLDVQIFNRWGQLVARLERMNQVWDGRSPTGEVLSEGTYFYTLRARNANGKPYDLAGTVTLVR